jgi:hypothetical protein
VIIHCGIKIFEKKKCFTIQSLALILSYNKILELQQFFINDLSQLSCLARNLKIKIKKKLKKNCIPQVFFFLSYSLVIDVVLFDKYLGHLMYITQYLFHSCIFIYTKQKTTMHIKPTAYNICVDSIKIENELNMLCTDILTYFYYFHDCVYYKSEYFMYIYGESKNIVHYNYDNVTNTFDM